MLSLQQAEPHALLILGLGNALCGDDSVGPAVVAQLTRYYARAESVTVLDGGTLGLALLPRLEDASDVIVVDAVQVSAAPGSVVRLQGDAVLPVWSSHHPSCHQLGLGELVQLARLRGATCTRLVLLGIVPEQVELGAARSAVVEAALPALTAAVVREATQLGYACAAKSVDGGYDNR